MTIVERMRAQLTQAMKARDAVKTGFLRYWIAQLTLGSGAELPEADAIKKMRAVLKEAKAGPTSFSPAEIELIKEWVPSPRSAASLSPLMCNSFVLPEDSSVHGSLDHDTVGKTGM